MSEGPIILFDGVCHLCDRAVQFILKRDLRQQFRFASLQSPAGQRLLDRFLPEGKDLTSIVLIADGVAYTKSDAALKIAENLRGPWPILRILRILPRGIRNRAYDFVARNRYRWFGKHSACLMPSPELRSRFLS